VARQGGQRDPAWRERRRSGEDKKKTRGRWGHTYAAVDLGTNNCRLLVARPTRDGFRVIDAFSRIVRLGEGVDRSGRLSPEAMERTITALKVCAAKMRRRGVTRARNVATAACRRASNCNEFLARVEHQTGLRLEIISPGEEANLAVTGCRPLLDRQSRHALVFDIGGGSTELIWVAHDQLRGAEPIAATSLPHGVVTLTEQYDGRELSPTVYEELVARICDELHPFEQAQQISRHIDGSAVQMIGTSGTVTTLSGVHLDLAKYDRQRVDGLWLSFVDALAVSRRLRDMSLEQRARHPCIGRDRADLVVAGCAILEAICRTWPVGRLRVGDRGLREGLLVSQMQAEDRGPPQQAAGS
jgi:exopolyphosphatase/guanosine-5'-triphosphate,3'-diphosphate pyrophosphatase